MNAKRFELLKRVSETIGNRLQRKPFLLYVYIITHMDDRFTMMDLDATKRDIFGGNMSRCVNILVEYNLIYIANSSAYDTVYSINYAVQLENKTDRIVLSYDKNTGLLKEEITKNCKLNKDIPPYRLSCRVSKTDGIEYATLYVSDANDIRDCVYTLKNAKDENGISVCIFIKDDTRSVYGTDKIRGTFVSPLLDKLIEDFEQLRRPQCSTHKMVKYLRPAYKFKSAVIQSITTQGSIDRNKCAYINDETGIHIMLDGVLKYIPYKIIFVTENMRCTKSDIVDTMETFICEVKRQNTLPAEARTVSFEKDVLDYYESWLINYIANEENENL